jgi:hypothetical protein
MSYKVKASLVGIGMVLFVGWAAAATEVYVTAFAA